MLTRRTLIATGAAALAAPRMAFAAERTDVVIVGGGFSGLHAAHILGELGMKVVVLEGGREVGGRAKTVQTVDGPIDIGASQIGRGYARVLDACRRYGLKLVAEDNDLLPFGGHLNGSWIDLATWESNPMNKTVGDERKIQPFMMGQHVLAKHNPLESVADWLDPRFSGYDISLHELMKRNGYSHAAIQLARLSTPGISIDETSVLRMLQEMMRGRIEGEFNAQATEDRNRLHSYGEVNDRNLVNGLAIINNLEGGIATLPRAMAAQLGDVVRLDQMVRRIDLADTGGTVTCADGATYSGRFIISAVPFGMLRDIEINGAPNPIGKRAINTMPYANTARMFLMVEKPFWKDDGLPASFSTDGPLGMFWAIDNHKGDGPHRAVVVMVGQAARQIGGLPREDAETRVLNELVRLRPAAKGLVRLQTYKDWQGDPLQKGCGFSLAPGDVNAYARDMLQPWQVMHFAGEHTRRMDYGMESAFESGERAALEIAERA